MAIKEKKFEYVDSEQVYVNKGYVIRFTHIPTNKEVWFKGLITDYRDQFSSNWNEQEVYGRQDPIVTFQGTKRNINFSWDVVASSFVEAQLNMEKISLLISMLYPVYSGDNASSITTAPLFKVGFANLIHNVNEGVGSGLVAKIDGFNFEPVLEEQFFDVFHNYLYPKSLKVSCNMTILHTHPLGWRADNKEARTKKFPYSEEYTPDPENIKTTEGVSADGTLEQQSAKQNLVLGVKK